MAFVTWQWGRQCVCAFDLIATGGCECAVSFSNTLRGEAVS